MAESKLNTSRKRILVVSQGVPHATKGASLVLFFHYLEGLRNAGYNVLHLLVTTSAFSEDLRAYRQHIETPGQFKVLPVLKEKLIKSGRFTHFIDATELKVHYSEVSEFNPDVSLCLDFPCAWAVQGWDIGRRVVWLGDLYFENYFYHAKYALQEGNGTRIQWILSYWHSYLWKRIYKRILSVFDFIVVSSGSSVQSLEALGLRSVYLPYPWPSEPPQVRPKKCTRPTFFFFGNLVGLGTRSALHRLIEDIYPRLISDYGSGQFEIRISGYGDLPYWFSAMISDKPEVRYLGFVDDLDAVMGESHALLAPIDVPVGNRSRILTALAKRMLVIAHNSTALGNPDLVDGVNCYLASTTQEFIDRLKRAVNDPVLSEEIATRGMDLYRMRFAPEKAVSSLLDVLNTVLV